MVDKMIGRRFKVDGPNGDRLWLQELVFLNRNSFIHYESCHIEHQWKISKGSDC